MLVHTIPQSLVLRCCKIIAFDGQKNVDVVCIRVTVVKEGIFFLSLGEIFFLSPLLWAMKLYILIFFWSVSGKTRISFDTFQFFLEEVDDTIK